MRGEWSVLPKRTASEHRELYDRIARLTTELESALLETGSGYIRSGGWGLRGISVNDLLIDSEVQNFKTVLENDEDSQRPNWEFPRVSELLARIRVAARRLSGEGPLHSQPKKRGAERGFFVRRMGEIFMQRYSQCPHEVIEVLTLLTFDQKIDRELVAKLLKQTGPLSPKKTSERSVR